jgi:alpha-mannosidase
MRIYFRTGTVNFPIREEYSYDLMRFLQEKIKKNEEILKEDLEQFIDKEYIEEVNYYINNDYELDTKYITQLLSCSPYEDDYRAMTLYILPEKYESDNSKVYYALCYIAEEEFE